MHEVSRVSSYQNPLFDLEQNNDLQIQREKINQFVQDNFYVYLSNVDHLDEAEVICLGETHGSEMHKKVNAHVIDLLYLEDSILLVESSNQDENSMILREENEQAKFVTQPIQIKGWDIDIDKHQSVKEFVEAEIIYENPHKMRYSLLKRSNLQKWTHDMENEQLSNYNLVKTLCACFCTFCSIMLFVKSCAPCIKKYYGIKATRGFQKIINNVPVRNRKMCETIQKVLETHRKVFVIGGSKHFEFVEEGEGIIGIDYGPSNRAIEQTIDFLVTKKFAILIPTFEEKTA